MQADVPPSEKAGERQGVESENQHSPEASKYPVSGFNLLGVSMSKITASVMRKSYQSAVWGSGEYNQTPPAFLIQF